MAKETTETRLEALEKEVKSLKRQVKAKDKQLQTLQDIEDIKKLQCAYGYYLEHWMGEEIVDCFAKSEEVSGTFVEGTYNGQAGIKKYFHPGRDVPSDFLHMVMQVSPVITVEPNGKKAYGRWYGYGTILSRPTLPLDPAYMAVIYEMDYIKEEGVWKILKLRLLMHYAYTNGKTPQGPPETKDSKGKAAPAPLKLSPDEWAEFDTEYPSGYIYPFHFKHPVTGKPTTEARRNASLKLKPNKYKSWR